MLVPAVTAAGPVLVTLTSAEVATAALAVDVLSALVGSLVVLLTLAVFEIVEPLASLALAWTTSVKVALAPAARVLMRPETVPAPPAGGLLKEKAGPLLCVSETNVEPAGTAAVNATACPS